MIRNVFFTRSQAMQLKTTLIRIEKQSVKQFDQFSGSMISASQKQNQMQTTKSLENNLSTNQLLK